MDLELLREMLEEAGEPRYRRDQVWAWLARGVSSYAEMSDLPAGLRERLAERVPISTLQVDQEAQARDGTVKVLLRTSEGHGVETVLMTYRDGRRSLCLSSQSGCPLTCTFCATGRMRFARNLTRDESSWGWASR
jgi:23S rRNA (adenine2503-C2)-methyltransferase